MHQVLVTTIGSTRPQLSVRERLKANSCFGLGSVFMIGTIMLGVLDAPTYVFAGTLFLSVCLLIVPVVIEFPKSRTRTTTLPTCVIQTPQHGRIDSVRPLPPVIPVQQVVFHPIYVHSQSGRPTEGSMDNQTEDDTISDLTGLDSPPPAYVNLTTSNRSIHFWYRPSDDPPSYYDVVRSRQDLNEVVPIHKPKDDTFLPTPQSQNQQNRDAMSQTVSEL